MRGAVRARIGRHPSSVGDRSDAAAPARVAPVTAERAAYAGAVMVLPAQSPLDRLAEPGHRACRRWRPPAASYLPRCAPARSSTPPASCRWSTARCPARQGRRRGHAGGGRPAGPDCALNALAAVDALVGLDPSSRVVKVVGFVASTPDFTGQPAVVNGASELLGEVFGDAGAHARSAVGVAALPLDAPVEVELIVEMR